MSMNDYSDYPMGDQDSHKKHMRHLKALEGAKKRLVASNMTKGTKKIKVSDKSDNYSLHKMTHAFENKVKFTGKGGLSKKQYDK